MEENNKIDQLFREGMEQEFPFDEKLWADVEGSLPSNSIGRGGLWVFNLNSIALFMILFVCAVIPTDTVKRPFEIDGKIANSKNLKAGSNTSNLNTTEEQTSNEKDNLNASEISNDKLENSNNDLKSIAEKTTESVDQSPLNLNDENKTVLTSSSKTVKTGNSPISETSSVAANSELQKKKDKDVIRQMKSAAVIDSGKYPTNIPSSELSSNIEPKLKQSNYANKSNETDKKDLNSSSDLLKIPQVFKSLKIDFIEPLGYYSLTNNLQTSLTPLSKDLKKRNLKKGFYYAELEISQSFSISKQLSGSNDDFINYKKENEQSLEQTNYGLNLFKQHKMLTYGAGLHYSVYSERVNYTLPKEVEGFTITFDTTYQVVNSNYNSNGTPVYLIEEQVNEIYNPALLVVDDRVVSINTFKRLRVPVFVGLQKSFSNWVTEIRTALVVNYLMEEEGIYINDGFDNIRSINNGKQTNHFVLGNKNDISLGFSLNEFFVIGGRYSYEQDLSSFTKEYNSRINSHSLGLWILWKPE